LRRKIFAVLGGGALWTSAVFLPAAAAPARTLVLGAYTTPREALNEIIPLFKAFWLRKTGEPVEVQASYLGSGAQSRAIAGGFEADVAVLSLEADVTRLEAAGLITRPWRDDRYKGMVTRSVVSFAVRRGNPEKVRDWPDLLRPGLEILTPDPKTSGGAQWNFLAAYGAARRGWVNGFSAGDPGARAFAKELLRRVKVMDKGARESIVNFERGLGDVAITYENEVRLSRRSGQEHELVIPRSTLLIENPAAVVDVYADKHGVRAAADAFVEFLRSPEAQRVFARYGYRPVSAEVAAEFEKEFPPVEDLWTIGEFGGWARATPAYFGPSGVYEELLRGIYSER